MEIGLMVEPQVGGSYQRLLELATWAEAFELDVFARSDHYLNGSESAAATDAVTSLAGLARETSRIKLAVLVTPLTFRHPGVIAKTATTIDEMSNGRFELGIGTGWMESEHERFGIDMPPLHTRFSQLYETLAYVNAAFGRHVTSTFKGRHYQLTEPGVQPGPTGDLPLIVGGGGGKKTPRLAGRFGSEYNLFMTDVATLNDRLDQMRGAALDAGRDHTEIKISMATQMVMGRDESEYRDRLAEIADSRGMSPREMESTFRNRGMPCGTQDQIAAHMAPLKNAGVSRIYLQKYAHLDDIDTSELEAEVSALRS